MSNKGSVLERLKKMIVEALEPISDDDRKYLDSVKNLSNVVLKYKGVDPLVIIDVDPEAQLYAVGVEFSLLKDGCKDVHHFSLGERFGKKCEIDSQLKSMAKNSKIAVFGGISNEISEMLVSHVHKKKARYGIKNLIYLSLDNSNVSHVYTLEGKKYDDLDSYKKSFDII